MIEVKDGRILTAFLSADKTCELMVFFYEFALKEQIRPPLSALFQTSINEGEVPLAWRSGNVWPIFKKSNNRPILFSIEITAKILVFIFGGDLHNKE